MPLDANDLRQITQVIDRHLEDKKEGFHIDPEEHYNQHKRLDRLLDAYEEAQNSFWKYLLRAVITGGILVAGWVTALKLGVMK